ncbi:hypothetical protein KC332_g1706 [Hortaea werneckii]|uniref:Uncharacterized protein n=1 Tax=Hortaea werneckii TaxID=91943 RepID=A0A3M7HZ46_HORWE|nr:hypothetical protein KC358_g3200 [Hortaea werneckii]KAI6849337.1 hypothetical protein KC350_g2674 [Hortaea werneckii]KAI6919531.1 hypothetical protein KC341_g17220 [Hortaea werneckii]KAI6946005.1 hypothetical protein KC348_g3426 [Hortaea werneckii]KAI6977852.1 hypothetical protein KC321_g3228 [Hortaea werneckii]
MLSRLIILSFAAYATAAFNVTFCSDQECKEPALGSIRLDREDVGRCRNDFAGNAMAVKSSYWREPGQENATRQELEGPLDEDAPLLNVRFYSSVDCFAHCGTNHLLAQMWQGFQSLVPRVPTVLEDGTSYYKAVRSAEYSALQSFELVEVDEDEHYAPHGYCGIRHGDAAYFRGRMWKWQQVGGMFREVPIEEWSDDLFPPQTTRAPMSMHGLVTSDGKIKYRQVFKQGFRGVALEEWDDDLHFKDEKELFIDDTTDEDRSDREAGRHLMAEEHADISKDAHEYL